jgi:hypothetical protein
LIDATRIVFSQTASDWADKARLLLVAGRRESVNRLISNLVILVIVGGTLTALALQKEFWPFSHFPMYSVTVDYRKPHLWYGVYGLVEKDGELTEVLLNGSKNFFPFTENKMMQSLVTTN